VGRYVRDGGGEWDGHEEDGAALWAREREERQRIQSRFGSMNRIEGRDSGERGEKKVRNMDAEIPRGDGRW
jgi:hypothetical protein